MAGPRQNERRSHRAHRLRRNVRQDRPHSDQDYGGERVRGAHGRARRRVWRGRRLSTCRRAAGHGPKRRSSVASRSARRLRRPDRDIAIAKATIANQCQGRYQMRLDILVASAPVMLFCASVLGASSKLSPADETAAFKAAGYTLKGKQWRACNDPTPSYTPGAVQEVRDVNGDGRPEAVITEGSAFCHGNTGVGYSLVSKQAD